MMDKVVIAVYYPPKEGPASATLLSTGLQLDILGTHLRSGSQEGGWTLIGAVNALWSYCLMKGRLLKKGWSSFWSGPDADHCTVLHPWPSAAKGHQDNRDPDSSCVLSVEPCLVSKFLRVLKDPVSLTTALLMEIKASNHHTWSAGCPWVFMMKLSTS